MFKVISTGVFIYYACDIKKNIGYLPIGWGVNLVGAITIMVLFFMKRNRDMEELQDEEFGSNDYIELSAKVYLENAQL